MTVTEAVTERILELGAVTAIVGTKVYAHMFHQNQIPPAVRVQRIDELEGTHLRGAGGPFRARVQVDSLASSLARAYALDAAVHGDGSGNGLSGWQGEVGSPSFTILAILPESPRDVYDPEELKQFRVMRDYIVWHR